MKKQSSLLTRDQVSQQIPPWIEKMRSAVDRLVKEKDIDEIILNQVNAAKKGDQNAIKFVFGQLLGGDSMRGATFVQNNYGSNSGENQRPDQPTPAIQGSEEKIEAMRRRVEAGIDTCNRNDGPKDD